MTQPFRTNSAYQKSAILDCFKFYIEKNLYGSDQVNDMCEDFKETITVEVATRIVNCQNIEVEAKDDIQKFVKKLETRDSNDFKHTPQTLIALSKLLLVAGDSRVASECLWGSLALALKKKAEGFGCNELRNHLSFERFSGKLALYSSDEVAFSEYFDVAARCHSNGFYEDAWTVNTVRKKIKTIQKYLDMLQDIDISEDDLVALRDENFNIRS